MSDARILNASTMIWFTSRISGASASTVPPSAAVSSAGVAISTSPLVISWIIDSTTLSPRPP